MIDIGLVLVVAALAAAPFYIVVTTRNRLVALDQRCETAYADIDAHLKHRQNLIPGLVETVRGFTKHEHDVLLGVTEARTAALNAIRPEARLEAEKNLSQTINTLIGTAERYPELRASSHFAALRDEFVAAENRITASRRFYNLAVGEYGATLRQFPGSLIARLWKMQLRKPFDLGIERVLIDEPAAFKF
ncbi:LemA family protein [uncultured Methylobacterium sp.]|uniref:LemA family protein n=1 Tax=uncultured Methylobacterium sp. TaxID=157278 RepID=UPI00259AA3A4|nr:LemA family protein [uncultured Methylobacterium sp.]